ncbi:hypothetical protein ABXV03_23255 [Streptomyces harbinensis]|uniref:hypothetical protein n=1 Tax=Streptomyces harbinensis TaxID=1176198 RepID=UPI00339301D1
MAEIETDADPAAGIEAARAVGSRTDDGSRPAPVEHTVAVTHDGPGIRTLP